jgi:hypothetical protein
LHNRSFTLADRCFAFTPAPGEAEGENYGANCNQELFHEVTPNSKYHKKVSLFFDLQLVQKSHTAWQYSGLSECPLCPLWFISGQTVLAQNSALSALIQ